ncbi:MAG: glycosyltransferase family 4 protein [Pseudomonadota bacterium]
MTSDEKINILTFTTLFPHAGQPNHGVFVLNRLANLVKTQAVAATVVAPVPWFPFKSDLFGAYAKFARAERRANARGLDVHHPRYPLIPKAGVFAAPQLLTRWAQPYVRKLVRNGLKVDLIDAHYAYPDGVAAAAIARDIGVPFCITARGTDVNYIPQNFPGPRRKILDALSAAGGLITVSDALKRNLEDLGVPAQKIRTLRNGVDLQMFHPPEDRGSLRKKLNFTRPTLLSVGHLIERKGHYLIIEAMNDLPGVDLVIVGDGPDEAALKHQAAGAGLAGRVRFAGRISHESLHEYYGAADALVLASSREGWANVLLEAMACGAPAVATQAGSARELISTDAAGRIIDTRDADAIAKAVKGLLDAPPDRNATRAYAERFSWEETSAGQMDLFKSILADTPRGKVETSA